MDRLSELTERNYRKIKEIAINITKNRSFADDLINETYILIHRRYKTIPQDDTGFVKVFSTLMKFQSIPEGSRKTRTSDYQRLINPVERPTEKYKHNEEEKEEDKTRLLDEIEAFKKSLDALELVMFELHYEMGLSLKKIVKMYEGNMSYDCLYNLYRPLKAKVKQLKWSI